MMSRGISNSFFQSGKNKGSLSITDKEMTRFNITLEEGVNFVLKVLKNSVGGNCL